MLICVITPLANTTYDPRLVPISPYLYVFNLFRIHTTSASLRENRCRRLPAYQHSRRHSWSRPLHTAVHCQQRLFAEPAFQISVRFHLTLCVLITVHVSLPMIDSCASRRRLTFPKSLPTRFLSWPIVLRRTARKSLGCWRHRLPRALEGRPSIFNVDARMRVRRPVKIGVALTMDYFLVTMGRIGGGIAAAPRSVDQWVGWAEPVIQRCRRPRTVHILSVRSQWFPHRSVIECRNKMGRRRTAGCCYISTLGLRRWSASESLRGLMSWWWP